MASFIISEAKYLNRHGEVRGAFWKDVKEEARREVAKLLLAKTTKDFLKAAAGKVSEQDRSYFVDGAFAELQRQS